MDEPGFDYAEAIEAHSKGFADAAEGNLEAQVEHCPDWSVADLVHHLTETHWFWATIAEERLGEPPDEARRPARAEPEQLIGRCRQAAEGLVRVLRTADPADKVWTWAPAQQDIAFITRHQVQEAAVHHWDAVHAAGGDLAIETAVAIDSINEFLTFSVSSDADPAEPPRPALDGRFGLRCTDSDATWTITDGAAAGTVSYLKGLQEGVSAIDASASDLLLWLYGRVPLEAGTVGEELTARFRALLFTD
jgi:uncharacterized protein (TIGR03083 family)